jgi:hypothetical protein
VGNESSHEDVWGSGGIVPQFLTSALDGGEWSASRPNCFTPEKRAPGNHWTGNWASLRAGLNAVEKKNSLTPAGNRAQAVQAVAIPTELTQLLLRSVRVGCRYLDYRAWNARMNWSGFGRKQQ